MSEENLDIFNKDYQASRVRYGKRVKGQQFDWFDNCLLGFFKHTVHIFAVIIILSFAIMIYIVTSSYGLDGYDENYDW